MHQFAERTVNLSATAGIVFDIFGYAAAAFFILFWTTAPRTLAEQIFTPTLLFMGLALVGAAVTYRLLKWSKQWYPISFGISLLFLMEINILADAHVIGGSLEIVFAALLGWYAGQGIARIVDRVFK